MKSKFLSIILIIVFGLNIFSKADEGMWLTLLLGKKNYADMQSKGLKLTQEQLYDINNNSLKDAIARLDYGSCSGEMISAEGLMLTNHHCGYGEIQSHSSTEHDYLTDGFWAMSKKEELPNPGKVVSFLVRVDDVTAKILAEISPSMTETERLAKVNEVSEKLKKEAIGDTHYEVDVKEMFGGNEYYLFLYETFKDIRLVGAPPSSVGKFGGDTDNWMWPRHTGDFCFFRVYMGPDGKPAEYSEKNVPYKPKHHLPISLKGVSEGDFAMIWGYPGRTNRYLSSYGVDLALEQTNPGIIDIRRKKLDIMDEDMKADPKVRIQYASKYASTANYWKYFIGQNNGLKNLNVIGKKKALETQFDKWANEDAERKAIYGNVLKDMKEAYAELKDKKYDLTKWYFNETFTGAEVLMFPYLLVANGLKTGVDTYANDKTAFDGLKETIESHFKDYNAATDQKILAATLKMYSERIPSEYHPEIIPNIIEKKYKGDFDKYAADVFKKSIFVSKEKLEAFLANPSKKVLEADPAYIAMGSILKSYINGVNPARKNADDKLKNSYRLFIDGLRKMQPDKNFYPDANSTMRCTYGKVGGYSPADAVKYSYITTLKGVIEKEDPTNDEFIVPKKLRDLYLTQNYGQYGVKCEKTGESYLPTCFLTNTDITGGNSGSPTINANGELIGTAFDGNWEAMSGDIAFEPELQRTIICDIRYILFIVDKYAGATHLVDEMTIVK